MHDFTYLERSSLLAEEAGNGTAELIKEEI
jgi:hypothetical protein